MKEKNVFKMSLESLEIINILHGNLGIDYDYIFNRAVLLLGREVGLKIALEHLDSSER